MERRQREKENVRKNQIVNGSLKLKYNVRISAFFFHLVAVSFGVWEEGMVFRLVRPRVKYIII